MGDDGDSKRVAVIDIGTNSTRMLIADVSGHRIEEVERRSTVTRLGRGVDYSGQLSPEAIEAVCGTIARYIEICEKSGAEVSWVIATSAVRDADNGAAFVAELRERFGFGATVLTGEEEASLTYLGAAADRDGSSRMLVVDIGGGSTEIVLGRGPETIFHTSLQAGVVRHTERRLVTDPPAMAEMEALSGDLEHLLAEALPEDLDRSVDIAVAVAGTPSSLAAMDLELDPYDPERVEGHRLGLDQIQTRVSRLSAIPLEKRREIVGLHPDRAPTIVAGSVILIEVMRAFGLDRIQVSEHDILYGAAITSARDGCRQAG